MTFVAFIENIAEYIWTLELNLLALFITEVIKSNILRILIGLCVRFT